MTPEAAEPPASASPPWVAFYPPDIDWHMPIPTRPVPELLDRAASRFPNNPAISFLGRVTTYADLAAEVDRVTAGLQNIGVRRGTKVGLFLPNTPTFIVYYYAILKAGGTVVNFNPLYTLEELTFQATDSETEIMVTHDLTVLFPKVEELMLRGVIRRTIVVPFTSVLPPLKAAPVFDFQEARNCRCRLVAGRRQGHQRRERSPAPPSRPSPVAIDPAEDVAVLQYTGGTTGTPKGAMLTHANLTANTAQIMAWGVNLEAGERKHPRRAAAVPRLRHDGGHEHGHRRWRRRSF